jgi:hypothetical protein
MEFDLRAGAGFDVRTRALILPGGKPRDVITSQGGELARQKERPEQALSEGDRHAGTGFSKFTPYGIDDAHGFGTHMETPLQPVDPVGMHRLRPRAAGPVKSPCQAGIYRDSRRLDPSSEYNLALAKC